MDGDTRHSSPFVFVCVLYPPPIFVAFGIALVGLLQDTDGATTESFEWLSQLRFDFDASARDPTTGLTVRMADAKFEYGFEYLGIGERLVQTPLTDRYY